MKIQAYLKLIISFFIVLIAANNYAMPPLMPGNEPDYPPGVNAPGQGNVNRDDPAIEGEMNCLVLLVDFEDYPWTNQDDERFQNEDTIYTAEHFNNMLFTDGEYRHPGSESEYTGSMRDYFTEVSGEMFTVTGEVHRWYRAPEPYSYYCNNDGEYDTEDDFGYRPYPRNVQGLVEDLLELADDDVDYSDYDYDDDGYLDALFVVHAGPGAETIGRNAEGANYFWSHKWQIPEMELDGTIISTYSLEPQDGTIGVFCHEFGHVIGIPDLYDTDGSSEGIGEWGLMAGGGWCAKTGDPLGSSPSHMCAWTKMKLDWVEVINVDESLEDVEIQPVQITSEVYRLWTQGDESDEYFLVEHRRRIGFDSGLTRRQVQHELPAPVGLLILHIDDNLWSNEDESHRLVDVEEASFVLLNGNPFENLDHDRTGTNLNLYNANRGDNGDIWPGFSEISDDSTDWIGNRERTNFGSRSTPSSFDYSGNPTLVEVYNIRIEDEIIIASFSVEPIEGVLFRLSEVSYDDSENGNEDDTPNPGETITISVIFENIGTVEAINVTGTLSSPSDHIHVISDSAGFGNIEPGRWGVSNDDYQIAISSDVPPRSTQPIILSLSCDNDEDMNLTIPLYITPEHEWYKYSGNPVFVQEEGLIASHDIIVEDGTLKYWSLVKDNNAPELHYMESDDGGFSWDEGEGPVHVFDQDYEWMSGGIGGIGLDNITEDLILLFTAQNAETEEVSIGAAFSNNGFDWEVYEQPVITQDNGWIQSLTFESNLGISQPMEGVLIGTFAGLNNDGASAIGYATGFSFSDFLDWTINDEESIIATGVEDDFDGRVVFSPDLYLSDDGITSLYTGRDFYRHDAPRFGMATTVDGESVERYLGTETGGSILEAGGEGDWGDRISLRGARLYMWDDQFRILYSAMSYIEDNRSSGLALASNGEFVGVSEDFEPRLNLPQTVLLNPAYPNPFNGQTSLSFYLPFAGKLEIAVFDVNGRMVGSLMNSITAGGFHSMNVDMDKISDSRLSSGLYFVNLKHNQYSVSSKILLIK